MRIEILPTSPTYGGGGALALVGDFLLDALPDVGDAIELVEVDLLLQSYPRAPRPVDPATSDEEIDALVDELTGGIGIGPNHPEWARRHEERRAQGPRLTFRRGAGRVAVRIVSDLSERDVFGEATASADVRLNVFATAAREIVEALLMVRGTASDRIVELALRALDRRDADQPSPRNEQLRQALR